MTYPGFYLQLSSLYAFLGGLGWGLGGEYEGDETKSCVTGKFQGDNPLCFSVLNVRRQTVCLPFFCVTPNPHLAKNLCVIFDSRR